ncbi:MAG: O-methyltransferase [Planctomycetota bacterium]|jgi:cephalosporin hydroxylase
MMERHPLRKVRRTLLRRWHFRAALKQFARFHDKPRTVEEIVQFARSLPGKGFFKIRTMQMLSELTALAQAVAALKPRVILEIGTAEGGTFFVWANLASEQVVSCDLEISEYVRQLIPAFKAKRSRCSLQFLEGDSHEESFFQEVERALDGRAVDFLFIDGDHSEEGVESDYRKYSPLVRPGGLIAFHDIADAQPLPENQVQHFWKRLKKEVDRFEEFIEDPMQCGAGIGIVRKPDTVHEKQC